MPEHGTKEICPSQDVPEASKFPTLEPLHPQANPRKAWFEYVNLMR